MKLFDSHAHLNFPDYTEDYREVWQRAAQAGLVGLINVGTDLATSRRGVEIAQELKLMAAVGIHPHDVKQYLGDESWKQSFEQMVTEEKVVAVGETGFDFYRQLSTREEQQPILEYFLELSERHGRPVIFHCRDAYQQLLEILQDHPTVRGVVHAFGGDAATAQKFLERGLFLSFTAQVTYPQNEEHFQKVLPTLPLDRILLETDCPFLPPEGLRGTRNEPRHVDIVAASVAKLLGQDKERVAEQTTANALKLFGLAK